MPEVDKQSFLNETETQRLREGTKIANNNLIQVSGNKRISDNDTTVIIKLKEYSKMQIQLDFRLQYNGSRSSPPGY